MKLFRIQTFQVGDTFVKTIYDFVSNILLIINCYVRYLNLAGTFGGLDCAEGWSWVG